MVWITNFVCNLFELRCRGLAGSLAHPVHLLNIVVQGSFQGMHKLQHSLLAIAREGTRDILLAEGLVKVAIHALHATPPAGTLHFLTGQRPAIEIELLVHERLAKKRGGSVDQLPTKINLPALEGDTGNELVDALEEFRGHHQVVVSLRSVHALEVLVPGKFRAQSANVLYRQPMIEIGRVAPLYDIERNLRQRCF